MRKHAQRGFTLIELLVVIAIIGILASIVLVSLSAARLKARDAERKGNLHNIALALEVYNTNHNGVYPVSGSGTITNATSWTTTTAEWTTGSQWIPELQADGLMSTVPKDPINIEVGPWPNGGPTSVSEIFAYLSDGKHYVLCGWMENTADVGTLQHLDIQDPWNPNNRLYANENYSGYEVCYAQ